MRTYESVPGARLDKAINVAASGANLFIGGRIEKCLVCFAFDFVVANDVSVDFEGTDGIVRAGPYPCLANGGLVRQFNPRGWFILPAGVGLCVWGWVGMCRLVVALVAR